MIRNYLKTAWRNLLKNKTFSLVNIAGLSAGMAVALMIGLWIRDELTFSKNHANYSRIVQVMQHLTHNGVVSTQQANPHLMGDALRQEYGGDFKHIAMASWPNTHFLSHNGQTISRMGNYFEAALPEMLTLDMKAGSRNGLQDVNVVMLSATSATALFGDKDPIGQIIRLDNSTPLTVTGVYRDLPANSAFAGMDVLLPWKLYLQENAWIAGMSDPWGSGFCQTFAQLADHADLETVSAKIRDLRMQHLQDDDKISKPEVFLFPMRKWHLYGQWKDGQNIGGGIQTVWLFGIIGAFVLLLACINFMNLSTARSEKRAREVGIRKAVGSQRKQLILQFFSESVLLSCIGFLFAILLSVLALPVFNDIAGKAVQMPFTDYWFWSAGLAFILFTGILAGSYPALYLSSFQPVKVLKGTFRPGKHAATPRKALVVLQFAVSIALIIGTVVVFSQIRHAQNRPSAYNRDGLVIVPMYTDELREKYDIIRQDLLARGTVAEVAKASSPPSEIYAFNGGYTWEGMDPSTQGNFACVDVSHEYGKAMQWEIVAGRDFSRAFASDSNAVILNESAVRFMQLQDPVGQTIRRYGRPLVVVGVVKDIIMQSPYSPVMRGIFHLSNRGGNAFLLRLDPGKSVAGSVAALQAVFEKHIPGVPFTYHFADVQYKQKFLSEQRIGKLSGYFAGLAIFISCLGLFGMASFMAEMRVKEIGVRKVMGASVFSLWRLMTADFVMLVLIGLLIGVPVAWLGMQRWLEGYDYRTEMSWWMVSFTALGAVAIALMTVSAQSIRAAMTDPVKSLRPE